MIVASLMFYVFAGLLILSALMVITARNPVHSVLFLILAFFNAAGLFLLLGAEFLAMLLVIVYVGAVAVLFLFVVMMLDINFLHLREGMSRYWPVGALVGVVLLVEIVMTIGASIISPEAVTQKFSPTPPLAEVTNTQAIGAILYTDYVYLFQAAGVVLLLSMVGAILLTHRRRPGVRKQKIADQVARGPHNTIEIKKIPTGGGI